MAAAALESCRVAFSRMAKRRAESEADGRRVGKDETANPIPSDPIAFLTLYTRSARAVLKPRLHTHAHTYTGEAEWRKDKRENRTRGCAKRRRWENNNARFFVRGEGITRHRARGRARVVGGDDLAFIKRGVVDSKGSRAAPSEIDFLRVFKTRERCTVCARSLSRMGRKKCLHSSALSRCCTSRGSYFRTRGK